MWAPDAEIVGDEPKQSQGHNNDVGLFNGAQVSSFEWEENDDPALNGERHYVPEMESASGAFRLRTKKQMKT